MDIQRRDPKGHDTTASSNERSIVVRQEGHQAQAPTIQQQILHCPGCGLGEARKPSELVQHIENGKCGKITLTDLEKRRDGLGTLRRGIAENERLKGDFSTHIAFEQKETAWQQENQKSRRKVSIKASELPDLARRGASTAPIVPSWMGRSSSGSREPSRELPISTVRSDAVEDDVGRLSGELPPAVSHRQTSFVNDPRQRSRESSIATVSSVQSEPDVNETNVGGCLDPYSGRYICPRQGCIKAFKRSGQLLAHIRGPAHGTKRYVCPRCHGWWTSLQGMTAHAESPASKCGIIGTNGFAQYMWQLTGGLIDVVFLEDAHDTILYRVSEEARHYFSEDRHNGQQETPDDDA